MSRPVLIDCPQCQGDMGARKPPRLGSGLGTLGIVLMICSITGILVGLTLLLFGAASAELDRDWAEFEHEFAMESLEELEGVPPEVRDEFRRNQDIAEKTLAGLPREVREEVETVLAEFHEEPVDPLFNPFSETGGYGRAMLAVAIPLLIVSLVLTRKRKIWLCLDCGHEQPR